MLHLFPQQFFIALRLVACAQNGLEVALKSLNVAVPPPKFVSLCFPCLIVYICMYYTIHLEVSSLFISLSWSVNIICTEFKLGKACTFFTAHLSEFCCSPAWYKQPAVSRSACWHTVGCQGEEPTSLLSLCLVICAFCRLPWYCCLHYWRTTERTKSIIFLWKISNQSLHM